ncbi:hypothetical protein SEA_MANTRA_79 [Mycobacterium phage Mantra]|uniref:Uncharacterized protein n=1 Tax=Mycobacterium phage Mantra TaxID=2283297 RepID=A0A345MG21_9CAUD|nr:hypothetical protein I5H60_gp079 [Mycobacterium phage Mantra]AXH69502.1 hypothetical protein SEA_MANTRA_79 [Mycobacterium phage Mantra]
MAHCEDLPVAEFIAAARTLIPELVAEVERLRKLVGGGSVSSEAQNVIADVIGKHRLEKGMRMGRGERVEWWYCLECEWRSEDFDLDDSEVRREIERVKRMHVADEVDKALGGLTREEQWVPVAYQGLIR